MARILIVEDEEKIARFVTLELEHEGYQVEHAADGRTAVDLALERNYDLILLDVLLPQLNGMEVLRRVRKHKDVPVIMVTARDAVMDKVAGLDAGADDYLTKPFAIEELFARIRVALKRSEAVRAASGVGGIGTGAAGGTGVGATAIPPVSDSTQVSASLSPATLAVGSVALDPDRREVTVGGSPIALTAREFDVLALLMAHAETVLTRERIAHEALGYEYMGDMPFRNVYFTGIVRDKIGRKMSKSLGNSPDPLELIEQFGADGVRMGMMLAAPAGNDILFDEALCEQGRNFNNKIWNAFRLVKGWQVADIEQPEYAKLATEWFDSMLAKTAEEVNDLFGKYRLSEALMAVYKLFWDEFSSWYLEMVKPAYGQPIDKVTYEKTLAFFETLLKLLHPFMPFITEELWQHIYDRQPGESIMTQTLVKDMPYNEALIAQFEAVKEVISGIRTIRLQKNIAQKEALALEVTGENPVAGFVSVIAKLCNLSEIKQVEIKSEGAAAFMVGTTEYAVPLGNLINVEEELKKLEADLKYQEGFLQSVMKKLSNEKFVSKAPANVIEMERKKQADAETKIAALKESIAALKR